MKIRLVAVFALFYTILGCDEQNRCYESVNTLMIVSLRSSDFSIYHSLIISGVGRVSPGDTIVRDTLSGQNKRFALPLSLSADSSGFVFSIENRPDTIYLKHSMILKFISESCGFAPEYTLTGSTFSSGIDSVKISDPEVNTKSIEKKINAQNIIVYFNPAVH